MSLLLVFVCRLVEQAGAGAKQEEEAETEQVEEADNNKDSDSHSLGTVNRRRTLWMLCLSIGKSWTIL
jgi:hypothetical protein